MMEPLADAELQFDLKGGWTKKICQRKTGASAGGWDCYIFAPNGTKLRSTQELIRFVFDYGLEQTIDPYEVNFDKSVATKANKGGAAAGRQKPNKSTMTLIKALSMGRDAFSSQEKPRPIKKKPAAAAAEKAAASGLNSSAAAKPAHFLTGGGGSDFSFGPKQTAYLERQYAKLPFPGQGAFSYMARQLKVDAYRVEDWFDEKHRADGDDDYDGGSKPLRKFDITDSWDHDFATTVVDDVMDEHFLIGIENAEEDHEYVNGGDADYYSVGYGEPGAAACILGEVEVDVEIDVGDEELDYS